MFMNGQLIRSRGIVAAMEGNYVVFFRVQKIYSECGTSTNRVWDVVDYSESKEGRFVGTYYSQAEAYRIMLGY